MDNSFTNKNKSLANYNNLTKFNGFYTNIYKEPFLSGFAFIFVTKPLLFIDPVKPSSDKDINQHLAYINMTRDPLFAQYLDNEKINNMDPKIVRMLSYNTDYRESNFIPIFTNEFKSFDAMDVSLDQSDAFDTKQGFKQPLPTHKSLSEATNSLTLSLTDDYNLSITKLISLWVNYINNITDGTFDANPEMILNGALDYNSSIYYFVLEPDGETLKYWAKYTGCWPTAIPYSVAKYNKGTADVGDIEVPFVYTVKEDMNPKILEDFNRVSLKLEYGKVESDNTSGYYTPIQNSPLLNETYMRSNPIISEALTKALNDPDRDPLVFFRPEKNTGDNTDGQKAHFALSFGENAYKSKLMEEVLDKSLDEKTATGLWDND